LLAALLVPVLLCLAAEAAGQVPEAQQEQTLPQAEQVPEAVPLRKSL